MELRICYEYGISGKGKVEGKIYIILYICAIGMRNGGRRLMSRAGVYHVTTDTKRVLAASEFRFRTRFGDFMSC